MVQLDGKTLAENKDYTIAYQNNVKVGTAQMIVTGMGNYVGSLSRSFRIVPGGTSENILRKNQDVQDGQRNEILQQLEQGENRQSKMTQQNDTASRKRIGTSL